MSTGGNLKIVLNNGVHIPLLGERSLNYRLTTEFKKQQTAQGSYAPPEDAEAQAAVTGWILTALQVLTLALFIYNALAAQDLITAKHYRVE